MEILLGKNAGFCYGVKRAVDGCIAEATSENKIYCLGELVHNKQVISDLERKGIIFIDNLKEVNDNNSKVIIRAHGVSKDIYEFANKKNIELIDYTCPNVLRIHDIAKNYNAKGYYIILTGNPNHPEVIGITSYCNNFSVIENNEEIEIALNNFKKSNINKLLLISQTTFSLEKFNTIKNELKKIIPLNVEFIVKNTICNATEVRQKEAEKLSKIVDMVIVIGGKNSSNTQKLYAIAEKNCENCICIETEKELVNINLSKINKIGILAGASTPDNIIDNVINFFK